MFTVYCVEDDSNIRELICYTLSSAGFTAEGFECAEDFFGAISLNIPDIVLLDIMLPDMDGTKILEKLKGDSKTKTVPVIFLTAKSERIDKIRGLDMGADDYITKPFDVLELISRVKAVLRRSHGANNTKGLVEYREITLDLQKRIAKVNENVVNLTYKEFELLYLLLSAEGKVVSRESIVSKIWGADFEGESRTLDVHIRTLRQKLSLAGDYIETVRNVGYKIG